MSLKFILGNSGSGKSRVLYETIIRSSMEAPGETFLVIVPEQFTLQTQKDLVSLHPRKGILNIDVLSFQRLAIRALNDAGVDRRKVLEETGKNLVIRRAAMEHEEELTLLKGSFKKTGYVKEVKSMLSELSQYRITPEHLEKLSERIQEKPKLYFKCRDLKILYQAFQKRMEEEYVTAEELLEVLADHAEKIGTFKGCTIALDGFTGFTPIQMELLKKLLPLAKRVLVTVTVDAREDFAKPYHMYELFYLSKKTIQGLERLAAETHTEIEEPLLLGKNGSVRFQNSPSLAHLEQNLFRRRNAFREEPKEISLHVLSNPKEEVHFAARTILQLTREQKWHYGEIALITGDMETYSREVRRIFPEYGIPFFIDETRKMLLNPFLEYIKSALEVVIQNFTYESVFRFLRTGLTDFAPETIDFVENYVCAAGIRGYSSWKEEWEGKTRTIPETDLPALNKFRQEFVEKMAPFAEGMKKKDGTVLDKCRTLYLFLAQERLEEKAAAMEASFEEKGEAELAKEYHQIYGTILSLLEKMVEFLGQEVLSLTEFKEILEAGFEDSKVGILPPSVDDVLVGDMERTRLKDIKGLFFLGLNEGIVPSQGGGGGLLSPKEREVLEGQGIVLAPGQKENSFTERFYLYLHLTKPSRRLYLTYARSDAEGKAMRPSYVVARIKRLFPKLMTVDEELNTPLCEKIWTEKNGLPYLTEGLRESAEGEASDAFRELYTWYYGKEAWRETLTKLLDAAFLKRRESGIGEEAARALYGSMLHNSVSRLETFAACAYSHFLKYGLKLTERETLEFAPMDMGNLFHKALELFGKKVEQSQYDWLDLPDSEGERLAEEAVREAVEEYGLLGLKKDKRSAYAVQRIRRIVKRSVWAILKQLKSGLFRPESFEVSFQSVEDLQSVNVELSKEERMKLKGRIDRIDDLVRDKEVFVKVMDYKSGGTKFDLAALYYGLQLQLVVYLNAAMELEKKIYPDKEIVPAGIFYYHVDDPVLEIHQNLETAALEENRLKELKPNGIVNDREDIIDALDHSFTQRSSVIPVVRNKNGSLGKLSKVMNTEQFASMSLFVNRKLKELGGRILEGDVSLNPYQRKNQTACDYCAFKEICGFDARMKDMEYRRLRELTPEEIFEKFKEEQE